ncbi:MAG: VWA domain-containing protein [Gemmataceae bacterium]
MLHLARPLYLLLLLLLPALVWWHRTRRRAGVPHPSLDALPAETGPRAWLVRHGGLTLRVAALALLVVALAGPRWPDLRTRLDTVGVALMMVVDVSGSMGERDFDGDTEPRSRLEAVKAVFRLFVAGGESDTGGRPVRFDGRPSDLVGLVCFATRPETVCPLTLSHSALLRLLDAEQPRTVPGESETNLSDAVAVGLARLRAPRAESLVVLTDGEHNQAQTRSGWSPLQTALAASLGVASTPSTPARQPPEDDDPASREAAGADAGGGDAAGDGAADWRAVLAARTAPCSPPPAASTGWNGCRSPAFQYRRYHEAYPWPGVVRLRVVCDGCGVRRHALATTSLTRDAHRVHPPLDAAPGRPAGAGGVDVARSPWPAARAGRTGGTDRRPPAAAAPAEPVAADGDVRRPGQSGGRHGRAALGTRLDAVGGAGARRGRRRRPEPQHVRRCADPRRAGAADPARPV